VHVNYTIRGWVGASNNEQCLRCGCSSPSCTVVLRAADILIQLAYTVLTTCKMSADLNDCIASGMWTLEYAKTARAPFAPTRWIPAARLSEASHWLTPGRSDQSAATSRPSLYTHIEISGRACFILYHCLTCIRSLYLILPTCKWLAPFAADV